MRIDPHWRRPLWVALTLILSALTSSHLPTSTVAAQSPGHRSQFCHVTDGMFTACAGGGQEWSDVTPQFFAESGSYLYVDQADLDPNLGTPTSPTDTLMLMYDECRATRRPGPNEYVYA